MTNNPYSQRNFNLTEQGKLEKRQPGLACRLKFEAAQQDENQKEQLEEQLRQLTQERDRINAEIEETKYKLEPYLTRSEKLSRSRVSR
jgi:hypothetical protein